MLGNAFGNTSKALTTIYRRNGVRFLCGRVDRHRGLREQLFQLWHEPIPEQGVSGKDDDRREPPGGDNEVMIAGSRTTGQT